MSRGRWALGLLALLAGCALPAAQAFRDTEARISSSSRFEAARFAGDWQLVAAFAPPEVGVGPVRYSVTATSGGGFAVETQAAPCPRPACAGERADYRAVPTGPGRFRIAAGDAPLQDEERWVLWVDDDFRTAVIGTPSGRLGWILDRRRQSSPDRLRAARSVLEWAGYDLTYLKEATP